MGVLRFCDRMLNNVEKRVSMACVGGSERERMFRLPDCAPVGRIARDTPMKRLTAGALTRTRLKWED